MRKQHSVATEVKLNVAPPAEKLVIPTDIILKERSAKGLFDAAAGKVDPELLKRLLLAPSQLSREALKAVIDRAPGSCVLRGCSQHAGGAARSRGSVRYHNEVSVCFGLPSTAAPVTTRKGEHGFRVMLHCSFRAPTGVLHEADVTLSEGGAYRVGAQTASRWRG